MMDSILTSIKKLLGISEDYEHFDADIIMHINSVLAILAQLGVGPTEGFSIRDKTATWGDYIGENAKKLNDVQMYIYLRVKLIFDPPSSASVIEAMTNAKNELEWRLSVSSDDV